MKMSEETCHTYKQDEQNVMLLVKDPKTVNKYTLQWREFKSYTLLLNCPLLTLYHTMIIFKGCFIKTDTIL